MVYILWLIALTGVYFILESIVSSVFAARFSNNLHFWLCKLVVVSVLFLAGLIILVKLPDILFATVATLTGICFVAKGAAKTALGIINKCILNETAEENTVCRNPAV